MNLFSKIFTFGVLSTLGITPALAVPAAPAALPRLTAWTMFLSADLVVKLVMLILIVASVTTWAIAVAKWTEFRKATRTIKADKKLLDAAISLDNAPSLGCMASAALLDVAKDEVRICIDMGNPKSTDAMTERLSVRLSASEGDAIQSMRSGFSVLASIGATSPFIGLFGTVWGIMNAFIGISETKTTNLAVVAPGIAEALLATALGLVAAIPAVVIYNQLVRGVTSYRALLGDASAQVMLLISRDHGRRSMPAARAAE